jgi:hypothetical protein
MTYLYDTGDRGDELYFQTLTKIQNILGTGNDLSTLEYLPFDKQEEIQSLISLANMYTNETYFTQGAFLHVVSRLQSGENIELSETDYINSMLENFFELLKEYALFKDTEDVNLFLKSSYKYLFRFYDAAKEAGLEINQELYDIFKDLDRLRKGNQDDYTNQKNLMQVQNELHNMILKNKETDLPANNNGFDIKEYMTFFWGVFLYLFRESVPQLPSPGTSRRSSISFKRRASSIPMNKSQIDVFKSLEYNMDNQRSINRSRNRSVNRSDNMRVIEEKAKDGRDGIKKLISQVKNKIK